MLTTNDFDNKVILEYYRDNQGNPRGVVVAIGPGIIGWSLCSKYDVFTKEQAKNIALHRAVKAQTLSTLIEDFKLYDEDGNCTDELTCSKRDLFYEALPQSLFNTFDKVLQRSYIYYKYKE